MKTQPGTSVPALHHAEFGAGTYPIRGLAPMCRVMTSPYGPDSAGRAEGTIMAATTGTTSFEVPAGRRPGLPAGWLLAPIAAGGAVLLALVVAVVFMAALHSLAPTPSGSSTGTPVIAPHPKPGPSGY
jgi:hypothetical protein